MNWLGVSLAVWLATELRLQWRERGDAVFARNSHKQLTLVKCIGLGVAAAVILQAWPGGTLPGDAATYRLVGGMLVAAGVGLRVWSVLTLGRFFRLAVVIQEGHQVIRSGPYRFVRHPSYAGFLLAGLGFGVSLANAASVLAVLILFGIGFHARMDAEEKALIEGLGNPYREYMQHTRRLVPGFY